MSLEAALIENTETMRRLIDALNAMVAPPTYTPPAEKVVEEVKPAVIEAPKAEKPAKVEKPAPEVKAEAEPAPVAEEAPTVTYTYDQVRKAVVSFAQAKSRDEVIAFLGSFGVTNAKDLAPAQYGKFLAALRAKLEG